MPRRTSCHGRSRKARDRRGVKARRSDTHHERLLLAGLRAIPLPYQTVLELQLFEDLSREETAIVLGIPAGTVASRVRRARELLAAAIETIGPGADLVTATVRGIDDWARRIRDGLERETG